MVAILGPVAGMAGMDSPSTSVRRRRVLGALAAVGAGSALADGAVARTTARGDRARSSSAGTVLEPAGGRDLRGAAEAVVDDDGTTAYCSVRDGFAVVDASDPANLEVLAEERDLTHDGSEPMGSIMDVKVSGDRLLVSGPNGFGEGLSGFFLYDVSDPANPERVAFHDTAFGPHNSFVDGDHVYLTGTGEPDSPVVVYDVAADDPQEVARWDATMADDAWASVPRRYVNCHDLYVQDDVLYVAYWDTGTWRVDVSDPTNPTAIDRLGGHDPAYLERIGRRSLEFFELPGNSHYVQPSADGSRVFVGKEAWDRQDSDVDGGPGGIECWDVSGDEPTLGSVLRPPLPGTEEDGDGWTAHNFGLDGDRLYASFYSGGVRVYDVADVTEPLLLGEWRDPSTTSFWSATPLDSGFVAASFQNPEAERGRGEDARVFAFPEPDDADAEPAPTMERREFPAPEDVDDGERTTVAGTARDPTTSEPTTAGTSARNGGGGTTTVVDDPSPVPGFGVLTALAGGSLAAWRLLGDDEDDA